LLDENLSPAIVVTLAQERVDVDLVRDRGDSMRPITSFSRARVSGGQDRRNVCPTSWRNSRIDISGPVSTSISTLSSTRSGHRSPTELHALLPVPGQPHLVTFGREEPAQALRQRTVPTWANIETDLPSSTRRKTWRSNDVGECPRGSSRDSPQPLGSLPECRSGRAHMDQELDRFKRSNLCEYAVSRGYRLIRRESTRAGGTRGSTASSVLLHHAGTDDKIVARLDRDGHWTYFSVRDDRDNGTIIDFALRRGARTISEVREELRAWAGDQRPSTERSAPAVVSAPKADRAAVIAAYERARSVPNHAYLNGRGIRPETLAFPRFAGTWRVDDRGDLLFPHRDGPAPEDVCGFERKSARFAGFSAGGTKTLWISNKRHDDVRLVMTEAVIDAFSYHQLQPDDRTRYASTSGAFGERQAVHVAAAIARMPAGSTLVIATDNDEAGERLASKIMVLAGRTRVARHAPPIGKDWNECLQRYERDYIRSLDVPSRGRER
jgi:hypothetical protein